MATVAKVRVAPSWNTRTAPERSAKNSRPSGAKASAVAKVAGMLRVGGACRATEHASAALVVVVGAGGAVVTVVEGATVLEGATVVDAGTSAGAVVVERF